MKVSSLLPILLLSLSANLSISHDSLSVLSFTKNISTLSSLTDFSIVEANKSVIKLYPQVRTESENSKITSIPINLLKSFMEHPSVIETDDIKKAPSIIGNSKNTYFSLPGDRIYAENILEPGRYIIYKPNQTIIDPETGKSLGQEILYIGEAKTIGPKENDKTLIRDERAQERLPQNERFSGARIFGQKAPPFI
ncbi:MAG: hypothetical protein N4Q30_04480, partial [Neisseriaceae bacterium]|nr:hypothetical protein [Neisseriaceae bacterium]